MDPRREKITGFVLVAGIVLMVCGGFLTWVFTLTGVFQATASRTPGTDELTTVGQIGNVPLMFLVIFLGMAMVIGALVSGLVYQRRSVRGPMRTVEHTYVLSRYILGRDQNLLVEAYGYTEEDEPRFYVRMQTAPGRVSEYECAPEVYFQTPEGAVGTAEIQGKWLGRFTVYRG